MGKITAPQELITRRVTTLLPGKTLLGMSQPVPVHPEPKCSNVASRPNTVEATGQKIAISVLVLSFCNTQHMPGQRSHALGRLWSIAPHLTLG